MAFADRAIWPWVLKELGETPMGKRKVLNSKSAQSARDAGERTEKIRRRAYELYELRGKQDGNDLDDWLAAEAEIEATPASQFGS